MKKLFTIILLSFLSFNFSAQIKPPTGSLKGSGTAGYIPMWSAAKTLTNSIINQNGSNIGINGPANTFKLSVHTNVDGDGLMLFNSSTNDYLGGIQKSNNSAFFSLYNQYGGVSIGQSQYSDCDYISNNRNLSIGGANGTAQFKLSVITATDGSGIMLMNTSGNYLGGIQKSGNSGYLTTYNSNSNEIILGTNIYHSSDYIDDNRNFGIGTKNPTSKFQVNGTVGFSSLPSYSISLLSGQLFKYADVGSPSGYSIGIMP